MKTIAIVNLKGGVAKTATSVNLGYDLATHYSKRVLVVDADQNMGATGLLLEPERNRNTLTALITGIEDYPYDLIYETRYPGLQIIPADEELATYGTDAFTTGKCRPSAICDLSIALAEDDAFDYVIIDSAPGMAAPMVCTVAAADEIIIPLNLDSYSLSGMRSLLAQIDSVRSIRPDVRVAGAVVTMLRADKDTDADLEELRKNSTVHMFDPIRWSPVVRSRTRGGGIIMEASPHCSASLDYKAFTNALFERGVL
ncbi:MAG TPA: ParA family protein [Pseudoflavonifractor sp.]|nr:ParA family protein [Pseudoflavonifractor sp.]